MIHFWPVRPPGPTAIDSWNFLNPGGTKRVCWQRVCETSTPHLCRPACTRSLMMQLLEAAAAKERFPTPADVAPVAGHHIRTIVLAAYKVRCPPQARTAHTHRSASLCFGSVIMPPESSPSHFPSS